MFDIVDNKDLIVATSWVISLSQNSSEQNCGWGSTVDSLVEGFQQKVRCLKIHNIITKHDNSQVIAKTID